MTDREIMCEECGACAVEVDRSTLGEDLDGIHATCMACHIDGKIIWQDDGDEDGPYTTLHFRALTERERSELAALAGEHDQADKAARRLADISAQTLASLDSEVAAGRIDVRGALDLAFLAGTEHMQDLLRAETERDIDAMFADHSEEQ